MKAEFGWTICRRCGNPYHVYKRDCPADAGHFAADLAPFTFPTRKMAEDKAKSLNEANGFGRILGEKTYSYSIYKP